MKTFPEGWLVRLVVLGTLMLTGTLMFSGTTLAQSGDVGLDTPIALEVPASLDNEIATRLEGLYSRMDGMGDVSVSVDNGIVTIAGTAPTEAAASEAARVARRVDGIVAVQDNIERTLAVTENVGRFQAQARELVEWAANGLPLALLALTVWALIFALGTWVSRRMVKGGILPGRHTLNPFLSAVIGQVVRIVAFFAGFVIALDLVGAGGFATTILGGAGVLGIAFGFAIRDTLENYISSILLSIRQPFRMGDHVVINAKHEGKVARLTSRATVLVTLDGNHLRIPNAEVFKGTILNYTTNPRRRFVFKIDITEDSDPIAAIEAGMTRMRGVPGVLSEPVPQGEIADVDSSAIHLQFSGWVDQATSDIGKVKSLAITAVKGALERRGVELPDDALTVRLETGEEEPPKAALVDAQLTLDTDAVASSPEAAISSEVASEAAKGSLLSDTAAVE